jgi:predicted PurR-regulated permease PerM
MEESRSHRNVRYELVTGDGQSIVNVSRRWIVGGSAASMGIFLLLFGTFLYVARPIIMPVLGATVIATTLSPLIKRAMRFGIPQWISALIVVAIFGLALSTIAAMIAGPVNEWIARAPEIESSIRRALSVLASPLAALRSLEDAFAGSEGGTISVGPSPPDVILPVLAFITPAAAQLLLFFGMLIFILANQIKLRANLAMLFGNRDTRLRLLDIVQDIEQNLARYLTVVTAINVVLGTIVALGAWMIGIPNPAIFGVLAAILNYVPYIGPGIMAFILFGVSLVTFSSFSHAVLAPLCVVALTALEGHFVTPMIVGRRLTLNPLVVFLGLAFWSWLWGPVGAFFAAPFLICGLVVYNHLFAEESVTLD